MSTEQPPTADCDADAKWDSRPRFALDADVTVYWPDVRPCYDACVTSPGVDQAGDVR